MVFRPKHHQACHLVASTLVWGSPTLWGCWTDESLNKGLKLIAQCAHRRVWYKRVLSEFRSAHGVGKVKRVRVS